MRAVAHAPDGVIEAVELEGSGFALGLQWHQELFAGTDHPGNRIFAGFVSAC
nr:gamma-glutamyl-gamma-aminobutyrate hydrolase family protein [Phenylobacterium glaciei]